MFRRLAPLLKLVAATFLILVLIDAAFFRSGVYARYEFTFKQGDTLIYEGDQTALWMKVSE